MRCHAEEDYRGDDDYAEPVACGRGDDVCSAACGARRRPPRRRPPPNGQYLLERVDDAAVVQVYADGFDGAAAQGEDAHLAPVPGGARRPRHLLRPAARARASRCATSSRPIVTHPAGVDPATLAEIRATRSCSGSTAARTTTSPRGSSCCTCTPDGVRGRGARRPQRRARRFRLQTGETLDQLLARLQPMFFDPNVDPIVTNKTPPAGQGHPHRQRQQPVRRRDDEGPRRASRSGTRSIRGS